MWKIPTVPFVAGMALLASGALLLTGCEEKKTPKKPKLDVTVQNITGPKISFGGVEYPKGRTCVQKGKAMELKLKVEAKGEVPAGGSLSAEFTLEPENAGFRMQEDADLSLGENVFPVVFIPADKSKKKATLHVAIDAEGMKLAKEIKVADIQLDAKGSCPGDGEIIEESK